MSEKKKDLEIVKDDSAEKIFLSDPEKSYLAQLVEARKNIDGQIESAVLSIAKNRGVESDGPTTWSIDASLTFIVKRTK